MRAASLGRPPPVAEGGAISVQRPRFLASLIRSLLRIDRLPGNAVPLQSFIHLEVGPTKGYPAVYGFDSRTGMEVERSDSCPRLWRSHSNRCQSTKTSASPAFGLFLPLGGLEDEILLEVHTQDNVAAILSVNGILFTQ